MVEYWRGVVEGLLACGVHPSQISTDGMVLLGGAVGSPAFCAAHIVAVAQRSVNAEVVNALAGWCPRTNSPCEIALPKQSALLLWRHCVWRRFVHLMRCMPPDQMVGVAALLYNDLSRQFLAKLLNINQIQEQIRQSFVGLDGDVADRLWFEQCCLPLSLGGVGLPLITLERSAVALVAATCLVTGEVQERFNLPVGDCRGSRSPGSW